MNKIVLKKIFWDKTLCDSRLELNIKGKVINHVIINSIRRIVLSRIPIYAFDKIIITNNTSIYNNNYLKLRINNLPVIGINNTIDIYKKQELVNEEKFDEKMGLITEIPFDRGIVNHDDIEMNIEKNINTSSLNQLTMYLKYKIDTNNNITVTTNDVKFYFGEKEIKNKYPNPIPIVKLQPKQNINLSAISTLGIEQESAIFSPVSIFTYKENNESDYNIILESRGQIDEKRILQVGILNLIEQLDIFVNMIPDNKGLEGKIIIPDTEHTIGNLIAYGLQQHNSVSFAGYNISHPLENKIIIHYNLKTGNFKNIIKDVVKKLIDIFTSIIKKINKL